MKEFIQIVSDFRVMLAESALRHREQENHKLALALQQCQSQMLEMVRLWENPSPVAALAGLTNVGKSTLLSALFGAKVSPMRNRPWSSVPVEYRFSEQFEVGAEFCNSIFRNRKLCSNTDELLDFIQKHATAGSGSSADILYAGIPSEILQEGLIIADTPGFGAARVAEGELHRRLLNAYLPRADRIFWVIQSQQGVSKVENDFFSEFLAVKCRDVIVNCYDPFTESEKMKFIQVNCSALPCSLNWHFIDAKSALLGKLNNNQEMLHQSGIDVFEDVLRNLSASTTRREIIEQGMIGLFNDLAYFRKKTKTAHFFSETRQLELQMKLKILRECQLKTAMECVILQ